MCTQPTEMISGSSAVNRNSIRSFISWILLFTMLFQGCTRYHTYELGKSSDLVPEINEKAENNYADVELRNSDKFLVKDLLFKPDSSYFYYVDKEREMGNSNAEINNILIVDRPKGALKGLAIGGAILGLLVGMYALEISCMYNLDIEGPHILAITMSAALVGGLIFGAPVGWIIGERDKYTIQQPDK